MHRVLQHRVSKMFLGRNGQLTPALRDALELPSLSAAVDECRRFHRAPSDFVYRVLAPMGGLREPWRPVDFEHGQVRP